MAALSYDLAQFPDSVQDAVARAAAPALAQESVMEEAVRLMRGPSSYWPVATGRSKRAWRVTGAGVFSRLYNPIRYAGDVEARGGKDGRPEPARRTLFRFARRLVRAAQRGQVLTARQRREQRRRVILDAAGVRQEIEERLAIRQRLFAPLRRRQRGVVRIPADLRLVQRRISQRAARFPGVRIAEIERLVAGLARRFRNQ